MNRLIKKILIIFCIIFIAFHLYAGLNGIPHIIEIVKLSNSDPNKLAEKSATEGDFRYIAVDRIALFFPGYAQDTIPNKHTIIKSTMPYASLQVDSQIHKHCKFEKSVKKLNPKAVVFSFFDLPVGQHAIDQKLMRPCIEVGSNLELVKILPHGTFAILKHIINRWLISDKF